MCEPEAVGSGGFFALLVAATAAAQNPPDARELVRRSIAQNQLDWVRMEDYTWQAESIEHHLGSNGQIRSTEEEKWETLILDGKPFRRMLERDRKPISEAEQRVQQKKIEDAARAETTESADQRQRRLKKAQDDRKREFAFLSEIPDLMDLTLEPGSAIEGRPVWVVSGKPKPGGQPKSSEARMLTKIIGRIWIDKATGQWAKVEAQTTDLVSWGLFLLRFSPGAHLTFEQTEVSPGIWLPHRLFIAGKGRVALFKHIAADQEVHWSNYRKFSVDATSHTDIR